MDNKTSSSSLLKTTIARWKPMMSKAYQSFVGFPLYVLTHPIDGYYEMKFEKKGQMKVAFFYFFLHSILGIVEYAYTGFIFNEVNPNTFRMFRSILVAIAPYLIFVVANWSITSLMDGKGKFKEIFMVIGYAFFPSVILRFLAVFLSNSFTLEEAFFYNGTIVFGYILTFSMIFMGIRSIHEYTLFRTVGTILLTFVSMSVIIFLGLLSVSLAQQIMVFLETVIKEIALRL